MSETIWLLIGTVVGGVTTLLVSTLTMGRALAGARARLSAEVVRQEEIRDRLARAESDVDAITKERDNAAHAAEEARVSAAGVQAELRVATEKHDEYVRGADQARKQLEAMFKALGADALKANNEQFMELAKAHFEKAQKQIGGHLGERNTQFEEMLKPFRETITRQQEMIERLEIKREKAYTAISEQVKMISDSHRSLKDETGRLVTALRRPEQRGRWGEMQLRNVVELAGMSDHCDFKEQVTVTTDEDAKLRPDMVVNLAGGGNIVVDSKVALDAYLEAIDCEDDEQRRALMVRHAMAVENHVKGLAEKRYWKQFDRTPKVVVMFMPIESGLYAALEVRPDLQTKAMESHVLIATPTTLVALLRSIAYGWQQEDVAANARDIADAGGVIYERLAKFTGMFSRVGDRLRQGTDAYNKAVGSLESTILPAARRMKELGVTNADDFDDPQIVDTEPRPIVKPELIEDDSMPLLEPTIDRPSSDGRGDDS
ncbi:MAG: DNA recombination protein RmuC [Phycisphaera sp.]|nr:DNA recombination protein RmuC [Phycisphaera sp.]